MRFTAGASWTELIRGRPRFALQIARANGANVIATTSSPDKARLLKELGATHVINYKETPNWGEEVQKLVRAECDFLLACAYVLRFFTYGED